MLDFVREHKVAVFLALFWAALFGLCLLFPYSGDDWAWGSQIGAERLSRLFANYNGRYLGNFIVLALTRNIVLRSFVVSGVLVLITYLLYVLAGRQRFSTLPLAAALLMLVYYRIGAQAIVWVAGFSNYAVPALLILVYLNASKGLLASDGAASVSVSAASDGHSAWRIVGMAVLGLCNSLIMENITLYNVAIACSLVAYSRIRRRQWPKIQFAFLAGALLGAAIMFSNGAYWDIAASGGDGIRSVADGFGVEKLGHMVYYLFADSWAVSLCMLVVVLYRFVKRKSGEDERFVAVDWAFLVSTIAMSVVSIVCVFVLESSGIAFGLAVAMVSAFFALSLAAHFFARREELYGRMGLLVIVSIVIIVAPLLVVDPVGPRNFFPTYVLECALACMMWDRYISVESRLITGAVCAILVAVMVRWFVVYAPIHTADSARNASVRAAAEAGQGHVAITALPNEGYVHTPDPTNGTWEHRYKLFYGIPDDFDIQLEGEK